ICSTLWIGVSFVAFFSEGVRAPGIGAAYVMIIIVSSYVLGWRAAIAFTGLSIIAGVVMAYAELNGLLPSPIRPTTPISIWATTTLVFIIVVVMLFITNKTVSESIRNAHHSQQALSKSNRFLQSEISKHKETEIQLRQSMNRYQTLYQETPIGILTFDEHGNIKTINKAGLDLLGSPSEELTKEINLFSFLPLKEVGFSGDCRRCIEEGGKITSEMPYITKWGKPGFFQYQIVPLKNHKGIIQEAICTFNDISEQRQVAEELRQIKIDEERYHAMLSHFINNDLQKIINNIDLVQMKHKSMNVLESNDLDEIVGLASRSSEIIDSVNKIFEVLQSRFIPAQEYFNLNEIVVKETNNFSSFEFNIDHDSLDFLINTDNYLRTVFSEILSFILQNSSDCSNSAFIIKIKGYQLDPHYCISIEEICTAPISEEISQRLSDRITDEWVYQGHFIGLSLASVIMQHYNGSILIRSKNIVGNEFQLLFPNELINRP
ncbi:MAG: PAS domain-containing sensor histidine kinase, partial [Candidatus Heimdallarchaeota archaeon]|nr:PAS domain-containing sensor histidine kinase [Candidatus Heimdallarchaeota archaeon]